MTERKMLKLDEAETCTLCRNDPIERVNTSEHMQWLGDELEDARQALRESVRTAKHWELRYRRLVTDLAEISKHGYDDLLAETPAKTYGPLVEVPNA